ncbi:hypothetical protein Thein_1637 [Thermodesulfatator indicus DSM 15286]|uniref:Uncharacterized protein n=1 Tax=Thermodesulfatator indicus (strain DSM 15286 / JCM 11887 / CIR29812) TaxID=667014 RepID=F8AAX8_THEID|nr:hypothetical protein [Thermodesulfatator indicus]AEH45497.1 hypothetical protein Thein_1637 [Thermodesulfatator indicus DSM 15286]
MSENYHVPHRLPPWVPWFAFLVGLTGAISLRLILIAKAYRPELITVFWYIGVLGNMLFFMFRAYVTGRRKKTIEELDLLNKLKHRRELSDEDFEALQYLVTSIKVSKERWNYFIIFFFSMLAIIWDLWLRFKP